MLNLPIAPLHRGKLCFFCSLLLGIKHLSHTPQLVFRHHLAYRVCILQQTILVILCTINRRNLLPAGLLTFWNPTYTSKYDDKLTIYFLTYRDAGQEEEEELTPWKEQENWEAHQVAKASMAAGARDRKQATQEYDFVLPDAVEFITAQAIAGSLVSCLRHCQRWPAA